MFENNSPRLDTPGIQKRFGVLKENQSVDVMIVGGGIAGCMTAYQLALHTDKKILLADAGYIGHGATGHNAGQIDVFFEQPVKELIDQFGTEKTKDGFENMFFARQLLEEIITHIGWQGQYNKYIGYNVYNTYDQLQYIQEQMMIFDSLQLQVNEIFGNSDRLKQEMIDHKIGAGVNWISEKEGNTLIGTTLMPWVCFEATHYASLNSALLCHSILDYLQETYSERILVVEETKIENIEKINTAYCTSTEQGKKIEAQEIVFCTNGYTLPEIIGCKSVSLKQEHVQGVMAGYILPSAKYPLTLGYEDEKTAGEYYYQSARTHTNSEFIQTTLVSIGGPNLVGDSDQEKETNINGLNGFIHKWYGREVNPQYTRSGLMCYTDTGMRKIGPDPSNPTVRYHLGCNGVGILGSIYGARKIVQQMNGVDFNPSVFDIG